MPVNQRWEEPVPEAKPYPRLEGKSRMRREPHVRFRESPGVKFPRATRLVIFGERHLRHLIREFAAHYHTERYHQGLGSQIIMPTPSPSNDNASLGAIGCRSRLGGLLNFYRREAA
jgi:hypothetical protein